MTANETPEAAAERMFPCVSQAGGYGHCPPSGHHDGNARHCANCLDALKVVAEIRAREKALVERCARIADQDGATYAKHRLQREADACAIVAESIRGREGKIREQEQGEKV